MGIRKGGLVSEAVGKTPYVRLETSSGGTDINQSTLFPWDSAATIDTDVYSYTSGNNYITVDKDGTYTILLTIGVSTGGAQRDSPNARLFKNRTSTGSGGTQLSASGKSGYMRENDGHNQSSLHLSWAGELSGGDTIAVQMSQEANSGTRNPVTNECNMFIRKEVR